MATAAISYDVSDFAGVDFDPARTKVYATNNAEDGVIHDVLGNKQYIGSGNGVASDNPKRSVGADGTGTITVPIPGAGFIPASWQTTIHFDGPDRNDPRRGRKTVSFGPYTITASGTLGSLIEEQAIPATYINQVTAQLDAKVTEAEAAADAAATSAAQAQSVADIDTPDALVATLVPSSSGSATSAALSATYARTVPPALELYEHQADGGKIVLFQDGATLYATSQNTTGTVYKSTDYGKTWTTKGATAMLTKVMLRIEGTGTLLAVQDTPSTTAGLNPKVMRSTDDGTTWTQVTTLNFPPLNASGITATPSGHVLIGEYGNIANTVYRVLRSTDDGQTFTAVLSSPGTDAASDPGHIHSVTFDPYANKFIAPMDRGAHEHWTSADEGATWTKVATASHVNHPNWVTPMFFPNHIAFGYDNENNGKIGVIPRTDYYAGNWGACQIALEVNHKAFYGAYPIADGVWTATTASEVIGADAKGAGSWATETYLIDETVSGSGNLRITGGFSYSSPLVRLDELKGYKALYPTHPFDVGHQGGKSWVNLNVGSGITYSAVPYSVGIAPKMRVSPSGSVGGWVIPNGAGLLSRRVDGTLERILDYTANDRIVIKNTKHALAPEIRISEDGTVNVVANGAVVQSWSAQPGGFMNSGALYVGANNTFPALMGGAGSPEGVKTAPFGSVFLRNDGSGSGNTVYIKTTTSGNTGWVPNGSVGPVVEKTASYTATGADRTIFLNGATVTLTLPDPSTLPVGREYRVKNNNAAAATVTSAVGTINGAASKSLAQHEAITVMAYGTGWHIVA